MQINALPVLLEKSPYKTENINNKVFEELKDA